MGVPRLWCGWVLPVGSWGWSKPVGGIGKLFLRVAIKHVS